MKLLAAFFLCMSLFSCSTISKKINYESNQLNRRAVDMKITGDEYMTKANYEKAFSYYKDALRFYTLCDDNLGLINICSDLGNVYVKERNFDEARLWFEKAIKIQVCEGLEEHTLAFVFHSYGDACYVFDEFDEAAVWYEKARRAYVRLGNNEGIGALALSRSKLYQRRGEMNASEAELAAAVSALELLFKTKKLKRIDLLASAYFAAGYFYYSTKDFAKSELFLMKALLVDKLNENSMGIAANYEALGRVYEAKIGPGSRAAYYYEKAFELYNVLNLHEQFVAVALRLADLYAVSGSFDLAIRYYESAQKIASDERLKQDIKRRKEAILHP